MTEKIIVLYIDDEGNNLTSFKASLRKDFKVFTALDAAEGLSIAETEEIHVVVADQRMPGMDGIEFFEKLMEINPEPVRILLTGYSDIASAIDAINRGQVYRFIDKPWNIEQIKNAVKTAADIYFARKELKDKNEKLMKIQKEMNQFVYTLSHELRGPLMSIAAVSRLAKIESQEPSVLEYFKLIDLATDKLDIFIHKMLDFYRSTKMENKVVKIDFHHVMNEIRSEYEKKFDLSDIAIKTEINQEEEFYADDAKVRVIINNLFSNAYRFQKEELTDKHIDISINVSNNLASIKISDNGKGMESTYLDQPFDIFQRATQEHLGSGLGLYMVKESVGQMGGKILMESVVGEGTTITVSIPDLRERPQED